jgi:hypothetical protein
MPISVPISPFDFLRFLPKNKEKLTQNDIDESFVNIVVCSENSFDAQTNRFNFTV